MRAGRRKQKVVDSILLNEVLHASLYTIALYICDGNCIGFFSSIDFKTESEKNIRMVLLAAKGVSTGVSVFKV